MTVQLTIIGLGQIGASAGLALEKHKDKITRYGHDREPNVARRAQALGAVDKVFHNLPASVEDAGFILLALPQDQVRETLKIIAPCLKEKTVVMDTSPVKSAVVSWAKEFLPSSRYYVGLTPAINPTYLLDLDAGVESAKDDLFAHGLIGISTPPGTVGEAVKLAADFVTLLGANPFFLDLAEVDGMLAALHLLPQLSAAALVNMASRRSGWTDARKLAGRPFAGATLPVLYGEEGKALAEAALHGQANLLPVLDEYILTLLELKDMLTADESEKVRKWIEEARQARSRWWRERSSGDWLAIDHKVVDVPKQTLGKRLFGDLGKLFSPPRRPSKDEEKK